MRTFLHMSLHIALWGAVVNGRLAEGSSSFGNAFLTKYPSSPITTRGCSTCVLCHSNPSNPGLDNVYRYGLEWRKRYNEKAPERTTAAVIRPAIDESFSEIERPPAPEGVVIDFDPDQDGQPNGDELANGTDPSSTNSFCSPLSGGIQKRQLANHESNPNMLEPACGSMGRGGPSSTDGLYVMIAFWIYRRSRSMIFAKA